MKPIKQQILCGLFAALMACGALVRIPGPFVPLTLQSFFALLAGLLLPPKSALISMLFYILLGLSGLPVFAGGGGIGYILQPSFGFIPGFALAAFLMALFRAHSKKNSIWAYFLSCVFGLSVLYSMGLLHLVLLSSFLHTLDFSRIFFPFLLLPLPGDLLCAYLASFCAKRLLPLFQNKNF